MKFPRRIFLLCALSAASCFTYTVLLITNDDSQVLKTWIEESQPLTQAVNSATFTRTSAFVEKNSAALGARIQPMLHAYAFSWIIGFAFFILLLATTTRRLRDYYIEVPLSSYPSSKPLLDHIAWKCMGILGCWAGASWAAELPGTVTRATFTSLLIPGTYYFLLASVAALWARFKFQYLKGHDDTETRLNG